MTFLFFLIVAVVAFFVFQSARKRYRDERNPVFRTGAAASGVASVVAGILALVQCFTVVPAGHVGVIDFFGNVSELTLKAGVNFVNPLAKVVKFSVKTQELKEQMDVPSKEGLTVQLEVSVLFHLDPEKAAEVYKTIGVDFISIILEPQFRSVSRGVTAGFDAKALYTSEREQLALLITRDLRVLVEPRGINVETTPLRRVGLPAGLSASIESKLRAEQESQQMQFVLQKERQEADRKRIEAGGISDFQRIIAQGLSDQLLRWKGIEATMKIAESNNAKVVIIGRTNDGLPIILDTK